MSEEKVKDTKEIVENTTTKEITPEEKVEKMAATENHATKRSISEETEDKPAEKKQKIEEKPAEKPAEKPKFVFGGSSTFSNGFKFNKDMIPSNAKKIKETEEKKEEEPKKETPVFGTFGSSTTFGQGFGLLKEIQKTKENTEEKKKEEAEEKPLLTKLETVENGEENEDIEFNSNTKMYSLTSLKEGWKERGVGPIHLNHNKETDSYRLVIRQRLTFQVLLNLKVVKGIKIFKGFPGSSNSERFVRIVVTVDKQVVQYCMKLNSEDLADKLFEKLESLV